MFSRFEFKKAINETQTEYHSRGFKSWNHFACMLFGHLSGQDSFRGIEAGLASQSKSLYHAGIKLIHRSTLSYANKYRSHMLFKKLFEWILSISENYAQHVLSSFYTLFYFLKYVKDTSFFTIPFNMV